MLLKCMNALGKNDLSKRLLKIAPTKTVVTNVAGDQRRIIVVGQYPGNGSRADD